MLIFIFLSFSFKINGCCVLKRVVKRIKCHILLFILISNNTLHIFLMNTHSHKDTPIFHFLKSRKVIPNKGWISIRECETINYFIFLIKFLIIQIRYRIHNLTHKPSIWQLSTLMESLWERQYCLDIRRYIWFYYFLNWSSYDLIKWRHFWHVLERL